MWQSCCLVQMGIGHPPAVATTFAAVSLVHCATRNLFREILLRHPKSQNSINGYLIYGISLRQPRRGQWPSSFKRARGPIQSTAEVPFIIYVQSVQSTSSSSDTGMGNSFYSRCRRRCQETKEWTPILVRCDYYYYVIPGRVVGHRQMTIYLFTVSDNHQMRSPVQRMQMSLEIG